MLLVDFIICVLAVLQTVYIFRKSPIFAGVRQWAELGCVSEHLSEASSYWLSTMLLCGWCFSYHAGWFVALLYTASSLISWLWESFGVWGFPVLLISFLCRLILYALAFSQFANLLHDFMKKVFDKVDLD